MWTVVYMAKCEEDVKLLAQKLKDNKIITRIKKVDDFFEMLVPADEIAEAHTIIIDSEI